MQGRRKVFKNSQELAVRILEAFASMIFVKKVEPHFMGSCSYASTYDSYKCSTASCEKRFAVPCLLTISRLP